MLKIGRFFLGAPCLAGALEEKGPEHLIVNLRGFDCVTFVESVVALFWCLGSQEKSFETFRKSLRNIHYRHGRLEGYSSRLHYFSEWIHDNQKKGILKDVTREIGGRPLGKAINYMTTHPELYPLLKNVAHFQSMEAVEERISRRPLFFIPKKFLKRLENRIADGESSPSRQMLKALMFSM